MRLNRSGHLIGRALPLLVVLAGAPALAQTGVSDDRVSLPDGPGSLGGMGEAASLDPNMGLLSYGIPIEVPQGFPNMTPSVRLSYSSGGGASVVGIGWSVAMPYIERMTSRGLPLYDLTDDFAVDGAQELVLLPGSNPPTYRSRFEGSFTRYTWQAAGDGSHGYWKAELPNGIVNYYGADRMGALVNTARVDGPDGTFRYHLVESVDPFGHRMRYEYQDFSGYTLLKRIGYVHDAQSNPRYTVEYDYEARDDHISDCKQGFCEVLQHRLKSVTVTAAGMTLRRFALSYESYMASGGASRLAKVEHFAGNNTRFPVVFNFGYSRALGGVCSGQNCSMPFLVNMGNAGQIPAGKATLLDINGDGLPDVVEAPGNGTPHNFYVSQLDADGTHTFLPARASQHGGSMGLERASVQLLDLDGDGFTDMADTKNLTVLLNKGTGDWTPMSVLSGGVGSLPDMDADDMAEGPRTIQFLDYDNDKRIDIIQGTRAATNIWRNTGTGFVQDMNVQDIGAGFDLDNMQMTDMNGDGLLDPTVVASGEVRYKLNLGFGQWGPWVVISNLNIQPSEVDFTDIEDINGDGISDVIVVLATQVKYFINRNGESFDAPQIITSAQGGGIPDRATHPVVMYADMNGNGSTDVVWVSTGGDVTYLELFPVRPNLISRIENGLGQVADITYGTGVQHMARDGMWAHRIPHSMLVVDSIDEYDLLNNVHTVIRYSYHDAFYDGVDKQFRGFERVEQDSTGDTTQAPGRTHYLFDLGVTDRYRAGLKLSSSTESDGAPISEVTTTYADCPVLEVPASGTKFPIRHVCSTGEIQTVKEGRPMSEWVTIETRKTWDGYGNVVHEEELGVTSIGGGACPACSAEPGMNSGPCGQMCLGDERYVDTSYVAPTATGGAWILHAVSRAKTASSMDMAAAAETHTYYDGPDFVGLAEGQLTMGLPTRVTQKRYVTGTEVVETQRVKFDAHGNVIEALDPLGMPGGDEHRSVWTYDDVGLRITRTEYLLKAADQTPYRLRRDYVYHPTFELPTEATNWMVVENGQVKSPRVSTGYAYDAFERLVSTTKPGDAAGTPSEEYTYELMSPVSRLIVRKRSQSGGALDVEEIRCIDGRGRDIQKRHKVSEGVYSVSGFSQYNNRGQRVRLYQPYQGTSSACDTTPPSGVLFEEMHYDGTGRLVKTTYPDDSLYGSRSEERTEYQPLATLKWSEGASDPNDPAHDTFTTTRHDGLERTTHIERLLTAGGMPAVYRVHYDASGQIGALTDPDGAVRRQVMDHFGNLLSATDGDRGTRTWEYLPTGQLARSVDATGKARGYAYDAMHRMVKEFEEGNEAATTVTYVHDRVKDCPATQCTNVAGQLAEVTYPVEDGTGSDWFGYDARARTSFFRRHVLGVDFDFTNAYDNLGRLTRADYPHGKSIQYAYDALGRTTQAPGYVDSVTYDARGLVGAFTLGNGITTTQTFDARERLAGVRSVKTGASPVVDWTYGRDRSGNILSIIDGRDVVDGPMGGARYTYDAFDRLATSTLDPGRAGLEETLTYAYANNGNISSAVSSKGAASAGHVGDYTYGEGMAGPHALTHAGTLAFEYDAAGRVTRRGAQQFEWDSRGRLARVTSGANELARVAYGPKEDRVIKRAGGHTTIYLTPDYEIRDGVSSVTVRIGAAGAARLTTVDHQTDLLSDIAPAAVTGTSAAPLGDSEINAADAWLGEAASADILQFSSPTTASPTRQLLAASARRLLFGAAPVKTFTHANHQGSTSAVTDDQGNLVQRTEYFPWGKVRFQEGGLPEDGLFTGKELDEETGLIDFGSRHLDPLTGRFIEADPAFEMMDDEALPVFEEMAHPYAYVRNNPINLRDQTGHLAELIGTGIILGIAVGASLAYVSDKAKNKPANPLKIVLGGVLGGIAGGLAASVGAPALLMGLAIAAVSKVAEIASYWATYGIARLFGADKNKADKIATVVSTVAGIGATAFGAGIDGAAAWAGSFALTKASEAAGEATLASTDIALNTGYDIREAYHEHKTNKAARNAGRRSTRPSLRRSNSSRSLTTSGAAQAQHTATPTPAVPSATPPATTSATSSSTTSPAANTRARSGSSASATTSTASAHP